LKIEFPLVLLKKQPGIIKEENSEINGSTEKSVNNINAGGEE